MSSEGYMYGLDTLERFRPDTPPETLAEDTGDALLILEGSLFAEGLVVAFDPAIANTGYAVVDRSGERLHILDMGVFSTTATPDRSSWDATFKRAVALDVFVRGLLCKWTPALVLHEMPPVGGGPTIHRADSSIVASCVVQLASAALEVPVQMVSAQKAKKVLTGKAKADKKQVRRVLEEMFPAEVKTRSLRWNEHSADALALVVTWGAR
jgi:Holliday junction resolvasome RuvABC endonuclease subunit